MQTGIILLEIVEEKQSVTKYSLVAKLCHMQIKNVDK